MCDISWRLILENLHQEFKDIKLGLLTIMIEMILFTIVFSSMIIYQTVKICQGFDNLNKQMEIKYEHIMETLTDIEIKLGGEVVNGQE